MKVFNTSLGRQHARAQLGAGEQRCAVRFQVARLRQSLQLVI